MGEIIRIIDFPSRLILAKALEHEIDGVSRLAVIGNPIALGRRGP
jgi:hypothetical protein